MSVTALRYRRDPLAPPVLERLGRTEGIRVRSYLIPARHRFDECKWCCVGKPAPIQWWWDRRTATTEGSAESCVDCSPKIVGVALFDCAGDGITAEYPVLLQEPAGQAAA